MNTIEIFEKRVKVELTDVVYREFGEDFVKFFDKDSGKYFEVIVREYKPEIKKEVKTPKFSNPSAISAAEYKKMIKGKGK